MVPASAASLALALALAAAAPPLSAQEPARESLEDFLERARARREELLTRLQGRVDALLTRAERAEPPRRNAERDAVANELAALGPQATPLLVRELDPGPDAPEGRRERAWVAALALRRTSVAPVVGDLLALLEGGSDSAREHAARALAGAPGDARVLPALRRAFREGGPGLREATLRSLVEIGASGEGEILQGVLGGGDALLVDIALGALAQERSESAAPAVRSLLVDTARAQRHLPALVAYYRALPRSFGEAELRALAKLAVSSAPVEQRVALLEDLARMWTSADSALERALEEPLRSSDTRVREAALVCLARLGDRSARKSLLQSYDDFVDKNDGYADAYARRAQVLARIGDDDGAIKDFNRALQAGRNDPTPQPDVYIGLARAYARRGKLREAADKLRSAPISPDHLRSLQDEEDFRALRDSKYGRELFKR